MNLPSKSILSVVFTLFVLFTRCSSEKGDGVGSESDDAGSVNDAETTDIRDGEAGSSRAGSGGEGGIDGGLGTSDDSGGGSSDIDETGDDGGTSCRTDEECTSDGLVCDTVNGICVECLSNTDCDDDNTCTEDICDSDSECTHKYLDGSCDDGNPCTTNDECNNGSCVGTPIDNAENDDGCCPDGENAATDNDCSPTCDDGIHNGNETDVDCGGTECVPCEIGEGCETRSDCMSNECDTDTGACVAATCNTPLASYGCTALVGLDFMSSGTQDGAAAMDGRRCAGWNSGNNEPGWWMVGFGEAMSFDRVILVPNMTPTTGEVIHILETSDDAFNFTEQLIISQSMTNSTIYEFDLPSPVIARYFRVLTTLTPSWVAWFEIGVFSCTSP